MNRYELGIKIDQIKKLAAKKDYAEAAAIAKEINWSKVKDWQSLATAINVQEAVGDYEEARDMAILAYNRNLGGRKLIYKLAEFFIKVGDFEHATELCDEYSKNSQHDVSRYILLYDLRKAQNASDNELIGILEDYRDHEIDEKYMYELAALYYKTGRKEECVKICDNIVLWFQDGRYVEKAVQLKEKLGVALTRTQKNILEDVRKRKDDSEAVKEELFAKQKALTDLKRDDVEDIFREEDEKMSAASDKKKEEPAPQKEELVPKKEEKAPEKAEPEKAELESENAEPEQEQINTEAHEDDKEQEDDGPLSIALVQNEQNNDIKEFVIKAINRNKKNEDSEPVQQDVTVRKLETPKVKKPQLKESLSEEEEKVFTNEINKANLSLKEIIANAKQKLANNYDKINKEAEAEQRREAEARIDEQLEDMDINVPVPDYNLYDTRNLQEELAANMSDLFKDEEEEDESFSTFIPESVQQEVNHGKTAELKIVNEAAEPATEAAASAVTENAAGAAAFQEPVDEQPEDDDQIEGQMDIAQWMQSMREEKYGNRDTKEFSKSELEKYLDEKEEKSAAYEKMVERKKSEAKSEGREIDKAQARHEALAQMAVDSARMDLAIRTGKASARLEQSIAEAARKAALNKPAVAAAAEEQNEPARAAAAEEQNEPARAAAAEEQNEPANASVAEEQNEPANTVVAEEQSEPANASAAEPVNEPVRAEESSVEIPLVTAQIPTVSEAMLSDINMIINEGTNMIDNNIDNNKEEGEEAAASQEIAAGVEPEETEPFMNSDMQPENMEEINTGIEEVEEETEKKLTGELAKIFRKYRDMPGLEEQLVDLFNSIDKEMHINTSSVGNILISGNSSSDKTDLARAIIRAINTLYPDKPKKIAKTSGESINQRGIAKAMGRLKGTALIVEGAGTIQPKRINELLNCLEQDTDRMIVIFEDSDTDMNVLINFNPELTRTFNHRIILKQYTVNELVEMAKRFARKRQYEVDDDALLELYLKIDKLHNVNDNIKLDDIKEVINRAIDNSERRASRRFFGGLKKKRSDNGDVIFLTEADFKDR